MTADAAPSPSPELNGGDAATLLAVLNSVSDAFIAIDRDWRITFVNDSYARLVAALHPTKAHLLGHNLWERFPDIVDSDVGRRYRAAMEQQKQDFFELFYQPLKVWLEVRVHPSPQGLGISVQGITERKAQEEQLRTLAARMEEQARLFDATLSHMNDLAYSFDREARVIYANKPLLKLWGRTLEEVVGKNVYDLHYPEPLASRLHGELLSVIETGRPVHGETPLEAADGSVDHHEYIYSPVFSPEGVVVAVAGTTRLVTARKKAEAALRKAKEEAEAANAAKDHFLAVLSHELRTPLAPVLISVAALEENPALPPAMREEVRMIHRNVALEARLIDDLLDLSSITNGKLQLRPAAQDVQEALRQVCEICRPQSQEKQIALRLRLSPKPLAVHADPARLQQMLWNVLKNAVKFTPAGGWIEIATEPAGENQVCVRITDSGIGIDPALLPRIFDAFEQGDARISQFGGLGLGLAITKALAELHGGSVSAHSEGSGMGAAFVLTLPMAADKVIAPGAIDDPAPAGTTTQADHPALRVLLAEDHEDTAWAMTRLLRRFGCQVSRASTLNAAVKLAGEETFDVLISDVGLPDGTGHELLREICAQHGNRQRGLRSIAVSGYGMEEDLQKSRAAGFEEHLVKPVGIQQLRDAIDRVRRTC
ncbi:MAG TPA: ATP-binding protein [Prosthecobacter sp.]